MQTPHLVRTSETHSEHICLIDSVLQALSSLGVARSRHEARRAEVCHAARARLAAHRGVLPEGPEVYPFLSHEDHKSPICVFLRRQTSIWAPGVSPETMGITIVVYDHFHRQTLMGADGSTQELPETHLLVRSRAPAPNAESEDVLVQPYCTAEEDAIGTPTDYAWVSPTPASLSAAVRPRAGSRCSRRRVSGASVCSAF